MEWCSICHKELPEKYDSTWTAPDGSELELYTTVGTSIIAETSIGELIVCESCYHSLPSYLSLGDKYEIYYQFALEYNNRHLYKESLLAAHDALSLKTTADALDAAGSAQSALGCYSEAISCYRKALEMDPAHPRARGNLAISEKEIAAINTRIPEK